MLTIFADIFCGVVSGIIHATGLLVAKKSDAKQTPIQSTLSNAARFLLIALLLVLSLRLVVTFPMLYMIFFFSGYWIIIYHYGVS